MRHDPDGGERPANSVDRSQTMPGPTISRERRARLTTKEGGTGRIAHPQNMIRLCAELASGLAFPKRAQLLASIR